MSYWIENPGETTFTAPCTECGSKTTDRRCTWNEHKTESQLKHSAICTSCKNAKKRRRRRR